MDNWKSLHEKRKQRNRTSLRKKSFGKFRLSINRSSKHIYGQIINDEQGKTLVSACSLEKEIKKQYGIKPILKLRKKAYDSILILVAHKKFKNMGIESIIKLCKKNSIFIK